MRRIVVTSVLGAWLAYAAWCHAWTVALLMQYQGIITVAALIVGVLVVAVWSAPRWRPPIDLAWQMALFPGMGMSQAMFYDSDDICERNGVAAGEVGL
ncbi:MAG: hypothetical protein EBS29_08100 [Chloroflexia bacterium]|nr:hypothetical protein [Chloroflexia bacterium]